MGGFVFGYQSLHQPRTRRAISTPTFFPEGPLHSHPGGPASSPILLLESSHLGSRMGPVWPRCCGGAGSSHTRYPSDWHLTSRHLGDPVMESGGSWCAPLGFLPRDPSISARVILVSEGRLLFPPSREDLECPGVTPGCSRVYVRV